MNRRWEWMIAAVLTLCGALQAHPHSRLTEGMDPNQDVGLEIFITPEEVRYEIMLSNGVLNLYVPRERGKYKFELVGDVFEMLDDRQRAQERESLENFFHELNPVEIDGVRVYPILRDFEFMIASHADSMLQHDQLPPDIRVILSYPTKGKPQRVSMVWEFFPPTHGANMFGRPKEVKIVARLDAFDENKIIEFTENEPEYTWHAPTAPAEGRIDPVLVEEQPVKWNVPVGSVALIGMAAGLGLFTGVSRAGRRRWRRLAPAAMMLLVAALALQNVGVMAVETPWRVKAAPPDEAAAKEVFTSLVRNVYRAFDYKQEGDVYDVLAQSVDGKLLDQVYNEVYQSLILRDQGGAVAQVKEVDILNADVLSSGVDADTGELAFKVRGRWRVRGVVYHWGHTHTRTNEYEAIYTVTQRDSKWKLTAAETLGQHRVPDQRSAHLDANSDEGSPRLARRP